MTQPPTNPPSKVHPFVTVSTEKRNLPGPGAIDSPQSPHRDHDIHRPATKPTPRHKVTYSQRDGLPTRSCTLPINAAIRLRANSKVTLLANSTSVLKKRIDGNEKLRQSSDEPLRTTKALVNAANIIEMPNNTTQLAVDDGAGE